jgi:hypothetical protein
MTNSELINFANSLQRLPVNKVESYFKTGLAKYGQELELHLQYTIPDLFEAWKTEPGRIKQVQELTECYRHKPTKEPANLPQMFSDSSDLIKLVQVLTENNYLDGLTWKGQPIEFAAMAAVCRPLLSPKHQNNGAAQHRAWNAYFKHESKANIVSNQYFKFEKANEVSDHLHKFEFLKNSFAQLRLLR